MICPTCHCDNWSIFNTRRQPRTNTIWRRRECNECGIRYTTQEFILGAKQGPNVSPEIVEAISRAEETSRKLTALREKVAEIEAILQEREDL